MLRSIISHSSVKAAFAPLLPLPVTLRRRGLVTASSSAQSRWLVSGVRVNNVSGIYASPAVESAVGFIGRALPQSSFTFISSTTSNKQIQSIRCMNSDSHDDFGPVKKSIPSDNQEIHDMIQDHITKNAVMLYMKGNPQQPMCGFSATVTSILRSYNVDFSSVNVLDYPSLRDGIKTFSNWPTIPQLYINGEFIGGCDIVKTMHENGELKELLQTIPQSTTDDKQTE
jgi:monothiol glutaredoxin